MGAEAKRYLQDHGIPQLFEGLMTGLVYNQPENPLEFLEGALARIRKQPDLALKWDFLVDSSVPPARYQPNGNVHAPHGEVESTAKRKSKHKKEAPNDEPTAGESRSAERGGRTSKSSGKASAGAHKSASPAPSAKSHHSEDSMGRQRVPSVTKAAAVAQIAPDAPIILFMGGPGGGKTRYATRIRDALEDRGLVHICVPDLIKEAIARYKDRFPEWKEAARRFDRGELIPNELAQQLVKAEMGRHPHARAYFLEGFPREARQVEDFKRNVRSVNMAMILDYDEETLRKHMAARGLSAEVVDRRISEFRMKTLPSAKYFDDHRLLHLIPGEKDADTIFERMKKLVTRALEAGVQPIVSQTPTSSQTVSGRGGSAHHSRFAADCKQAGVRGREPRRGKSTGKRRKRGRLSVADQRRRGLDSTVASTDGGQRNSAERFGGPNFPHARRKKSLSLCGSRVKWLLSAESAAATQRPESSAQPLTNGKATPASSTREHADQSADRPLDSRSNSRGSRPEASPSPTAQRLAQSRPSTTGQSIAAMRNAPIGAGSRAESEKALTRSNSQTSAPSRQSNAAANGETAAGSRQSSVGRSGTRGEAASKPPTPHGSRPATQTSKRSTAESPAAAARPEAADRRTPAVLRRLHAEANGRQLRGPFRKRTAAGRLSPLRTRVAFPTAADRFPRGLPNNAPVVLVIGAPGSNKSDVAERLARKYDGFIHLSMGELLRRKVQQNAGDELWSRVGKKMDNGEAIPMKICRDILYSAIHEAGARSWGYVIEGKQWRRYPRSLAQAEDIEQQLDRLDVAVLLDCTEQFCRDNLSKRWEENQQRGGGERPDDEENAAKQRLNAFKQNTLPMLKHLDDMGKLRVVEGDNGSEKLFTDVARLLDETVFIKEERGAADAIDRPASKPLAT
ncbi:hypothetical protein M3Y99_00064800 [Aphelenchoides fujianensis]|nr:hypothetical protein M3Y99_00064800 [Aphelenchoides fujianensis]